MGRRCSKKIQEQKEDFAKTICDEVGKPISLARVEVDRCRETIKSQFMLWYPYLARTFDSIIMASGKKSVKFFQRELVRGSK